MKTFNDLEEIKNTSASLTDFIVSAIHEHKSSEMYRFALIAYDYFRQRNTTILNYQKLLYTMSGKTVPDNYSANYKCVSNFFQKFVIQENLHLLGNGITFDEDTTKDKLGGTDFDHQLIKIGEASLWGGVAFGFFNLDHLEVFTVKEFVPLVDEEDGSIKAGIRFWQIDDNKPLRMTLYEIDGYTEYMSYQGEVTILVDKRPYKMIVRQSVADGMEILDGENYPTFPIVPLWGNLEHQSELVGLRSEIDAYDLIKSGFANDLDDASQIYWTIQNAGGMDDVDLAKFIERMKTVKAAVVDEQGSTAEAHTLEVPYNAREAILDRLRSDMYEDYMALDTKEISSGSLTATAIRASYENLNLKCDRYEMCVSEFVFNILRLLGINDEFAFTRSAIVNQLEDTQMVLSAAQYLDDETILKHLPFLNADEIDGILDRVTEEEANRFEDVNEQVEDENPIEGEE